MGLKPRALSDDFVTRNLRPGQPVTLMPGERAPDSLYRAGQPETLDTGFEYLPLAQQQARLKDILGRAATQASRFSAQGPSFGLQTASQPPMQDQGAQMPDLQQPSGGGLGIALQNAIRGPEPTSEALGEPAPKRSGFGAILAKLGDLGEYISATQGNEHAIRSITAREQAEQSEALWSRRQQVEDQQWDRRQQIEDDRWLRRQQYEAQNRPPSEFERLLEASGVQRGSPEWTAAMGRKVERQLAEPEAVVPLPDGRIYIGPRSGIGAAIAGGAQPTAPVGKLRPVGGPTPPASGTFRP